MLREHCQHRNLRQLAHVHIGEYPRIQPGPRSRSSVTGMICVELSFTDDPHRLEARPEHRRRLEELHRRGQLFLAGPWDDESGALLVFTMDRAGVDDAVAADPYFTTAGVEIVAIRQWCPVVRDAGQSRT